MKCNYLFTVVMAPHTWFEMEELEFHEKRYIIWDEYDHMFMPSSAFYSWIKDNFQAQEIFRARYQLKWDELRECEKITAEFENSGMVSYVYSDMPVFYNSETAVEYFLRLNWNRKFDDYKVVSVYAEKSYLEHAIKSGTSDRHNSLMNHYSQDRSRSIEEQELIVLGYDIINTQDIGSNLRYCTAFEKDKYIRFENEFGLINSYTNAVKILEELDFEKESSFVMNEGEHMEMLHRKGNWLPIIMAEE